VHVTRFWRTTGRPCRFEGPDQTMHGAAIQEGEKVGDQFDRLVNLERDQHQRDQLALVQPRLRGAVGQRPIGLHGARHTHATLALAAGARLDVVSRQLGHASIAITADVYGHPDDKAASEAAEIVGRVISEG
jgi:integrase